MIFVTGPTPASDTVSERVARLVDLRVASRIASRDDLVWGLEAASEAGQRLGWVDSPAAMESLVSELVDQRQKMIDRGIRRVVLCGMGGSSLAPEVIAAEASIPLTILDSTHPDQVRAALQGDLRETLVVVSSKSGTTVETASAKMAFEAAFRAASVDPHNHIVIVTDPGSPLDQESRAAGFLVYNANPNVGGRFSALTAFGLVPTTLAGVDTVRLISDAAFSVEAMAIDSAENPAVRLAAMMSDPSRPYCFLLPGDDTLPGLGDWIEQLVAESTGKEGTGILPVVLSDSSEVTSVGVPSDAIVVELTSTADQASGKYPGVAGSLGEQFVVWQWATAMAGYLLGINPFDQPDVESAKSATRNFLSETPEVPSPVFVESGVSVSSQHLDLDSSGSLAGIWQVVSDRARDGYIALQVYANRENSAPWRRVRRLIATQSQRPVTLGFGPRFLHSTGQFHKGGRPAGVFVQVEVTAAHDLDIPDFPYGFGTLIDAQSAGDRQVLARRGLPIVTLRVTGETALQALLDSIGQK